MLTLHFNNQVIPTSTDFSIKMKWVNPACFMSNVPGNAGLGIDIPVNDYSRAIFGNPHRFEKYSTTNDRKFPGFEVRFGGVLLMSGTLIINNATTEQYSGWLQSELGSLGDEQRDKTVPDMEWKQGAVFNNKTSYDDAEDAYSAYPVRNRAFWNGKGRETALTTKYTDEDNVEREVGDMVNYLAWVSWRDFYGYVNALGEGGVKTSGEACVVSPFLYLRFVIREMLKTVKFSIDRNDMKSDLVDINLAKYLVFYNNFNIVTQTFVTQPIIHKYFDRELNAVIEKAENKIIRTDWHLNPFSYKNLLPSVAMKDLLLGLQNYLNFVFVFKSLNKVDIIDRNRILTDQAFDLDVYFTGNWIIGERKDVSLKFVMALDKEDRMYGQEFHDLTERKDDFREPVSNYAALEALQNPMIGELRLVKDTNKIYEYKWKVLSGEDALLRESQFDALGWEFISSGPQPFLFGEAKQIEEIKTCFSTLQETIEGFGFPVVLQQGNLERMKQLWTSFTPRLINTNKLLYPEALNWEGDNGLFEKRWKNWARFWARRLPVEGSFFLPLNIIYYVINNLTQKFRTDNGEFLIEEMETEFSANRIGKTTIRGYKV